MKPMKEQISSSFSSTSLHFYVMGLKAHLCVEFHSEPRREAVPDSQAGCACISASDSVAGRFGGG